MPGTIDFTGFDYADVCYGTVENADVFFGKVPQHLDDWSGANSEEKQKALYEATLAIDRLLFRGYKTPVYNLYANATPEAPPSADAIATADASQLLQFPRDGGEEIPEDIVRATYYEAQSILAGRNSGLELENLAVTQDGAGSTRTSFNREHTPVRHLVNGITSNFAWRFIQPFLADISTFDVRRV